MLKALHTRGRRKSFSHIGRVCFKGKCRERSDKELKGGSVLTEKEIEWIE